MEVHGNNPGGKTKTKTEGLNSVDSRKSERVSAWVGTLQPGSLWSLETEKVPDAEGKEVMIPRTVFP